MIGDMTTDINFGCLRPLPAGYRVFWDSVVQDYFGTSPDGVDECSGDRFDCRRWCFEDAVSAEPGSVRS